MISIARRRLMQAVMSGALMVWAGKALAWGSEGHRITGLVAQRLLTPEAAAGIAALMGRTDLAADAVYLDVNKFALDKRIPGSRQWHYDDRPVCDAQVKHAAYCPQGDCASTQIMRHYHALIDKRTTDDEKRFAIYVLVHLVGDVHQPLHGSDNGDHGGNTVKVQFTLPSGRKRTTSLHSAWDSDFVKAAFSTADERMIAQDLVDRYTDKVPVWQQEDAAAKWLAETYTTSTSFAYGRLPGIQCGSADFGRQKIVLDADYVGKALEIVPEQLAKAGVCIAYLLNRAFANQTP